MDKPVWSERTVSIAELKPNPHNPRTITGEQYRKLKKSLAETGYHGRLLVDKDLNVLGGHMRLRALIELGYKEVPVLVADRELTVMEKNRISVQDNLEFGNWDLDLLSAQIDPDDLLHWGFPEKLVGSIDEIPDEEPEKDEEKQEKVCPHCGGAL